MRGSTLPSKRIPFKRKLEKGRRKALFWDVFRILQSRTPSPRLRLRFVFTPSTPRRESEDDTPPTEGSVPRETNGDFLFFKAPLNGGPSRERHPFLIRPSFSRCTVMTRDVRPGGLEKPCTPPFHFTSVSRGQGLVAADTGVNLPLSS